MTNAWTFLRLLLMISYLGIISTISAQELKRSCGTVDHLNHLIESHPNMRQSMQRIENNAFRVTNGSVKSVKGKISIPIVIHVVYNTAEQNISDQQIYSQIKVLNEDYQRLNSDTSNTPDPFKAVAASSGIEFRLASKDPDGNPTSGIIRKKTGKSAFYTTSNNIKYSNMGGSDAWPRDKYLNIWVGPMGLGVLGYAQFPGGPAETDGVVINYKAFGTMGTVMAPFTLGRTATHEVGHWLNLKHISGDGPCGVDDGVADTPPTDRQHYGCAMGFSSCGNLDMVTNFMDYSDDGCMNLFTKGQASRMRALFAPGGFRHSILNSDGLENVTPIATVEPPATIKLSTVGENRARIDWEQLKGVSAYLVRLKREGTGKWITKPFDRNFVNASKLKSCSQYEIQVASVVGGEVSDFSSSLIFETQGCTDEGYQNPMEHGPSNIRVSSLTEESAKIDWRKVEQASNYKVQYKVAGAKQVYSKIVTDNSASLSRLKKGQRYLFRIRANQGEKNGAYSEISSFVLPGQNSFATLRTANPNMGGFAEFVEAFPDTDAMKVELRMNVTEQQAIRIWVKNVRGKSVLAKKVYQISPNKPLIMDLSHLPRERYYIEIEEQGGFDHQVYLDLR
ncbi:MAG: M43 family zinc metalloprotease [Bacteroidia bacterium]|nr:M43 family zinc metalloprotease [Bacteroidia bacterium]